jgi:hypothetical protein
VRLRRCDPASGLPLAPLAAAAAAASAGPAATLGELGVVDRLELVLEARPGGGGGDSDWPRYDPEDRPVWLVVGAARGGAEAGEGAGAVEWAAPVAFEVLRWAQSPGHYTPPIPPLSP